MITICIIIAILCLIMFGVSICIIAGGLTGLAIVADLIVAGLVIAFLIKIIKG